MIIDIKDNNRKLLKGDDFVNFDKNGKK
ncbi:hypothetical protein D910_08154 [Dendroctonus ponderosae]|uniref:Uncharacterized protein n=1 Tax=Dendroctonus ponderosae TaxID=77166 RepID=U4UEP5_DENPD|nr:hypothetical protein D910_08154 [Dendroctonus ponderosae]